MVGSTIIMARLPAGEASGMLCGARGNREVWIEKLVAGELGSGDVRGDSRGRVWRGVKEYGLYHDQASRLLSFVLCAAAVSQRCRTR